MSAPRWNIALPIEGSLQLAPSGSLLGRIRLPYPSLFTYRNDPVVNFEWRAWRWIINIGICLFICGVIPITVITQGYETVATYAVDFNTTTSHWWYKPAPGSQCDPHIFTVGDTFVTNIGSFVWTVIAANSVQTQVKSGSLVAPKTSTTGQYSGTSLDWCDVSTLHVLVDIVQFKSQVTAVIVCYGEDFLLASTVVNSGLQDDAWFEAKVSNLQLSNSWAKGFVEQTAMDLIIEMYNLAAITNASQAMRTLAFTTYPTQCPGQYIKDPHGFSDTAFLNKASEVLVDQRPWCTQEDLTAPPASGLVWSLDTIQIIPFNVPVPVYAIANAVNNTLQATIAAVRWDLGNRLPNVISNTREVLTQNETFFHPFSMPAPNAGDLFNYLDTNPWNTTGSFDYLPDTPLFLVDYLCYLSVLKSASSLFVSVLIGTLSICTSAWTFLLLFCAWAYKESLKRQAEMAKLPPQVQGDLQRPVPEGYAIPSEAKVGYTFSTATPGYEKTVDPISSYYGPEYQPMLPGSLHPDAAPNDG